jgi:transcriptional regulator with XRE-family HTH domain
MTTDELDPQAQPLYKWRRISGLKLREVAEMLDWPEIRLARLETDLVPPTQEELNALSSVYGYKPSELLRPPSRDILRRVFGYSPPGFTQKEGNIIRRALWIAIAHGAVFEQRHVESIRRKLTRYHDKNASRTNLANGLANDGKLGPE